MQRSTLGPLLLTTLFLAGHAMADGPASALVGTWRGSYSCLQGHTGLQLSVATSVDTSFTGEFGFYAAPDNPRVPSGRFAIRGTFNPKSGQVDFFGVKWIEQPTNYRMVNLHGTLSEDGSAIDGKVEFAGCTSFHVARLGAAHKSTKPKDSMK